MYPDDPLFLGPAEGRQAGPLILGVPWPVPPALVRTAAELAAGLEVHLVCAFVDPASYLTEWEPLRTLSAVSLDPAPDTSGEAAFAAVDVRGALEGILGPGGPGWSFRALNGDVSSALSGLAERPGPAWWWSAGAGLGSVAREPAVGRGCVSAADQFQNRPVVVVPENSARDRKAASRRRTGA